MGEVVGGVVAVPGGGDGAQVGVEAEFLAQFAVGGVQGGLAGVDDATGEAVVGAGVEVLDVGAAVHEDAAGGGVAQQDAGGGVGEVAGADLGAWGTAGDPSGTVRRVVEVDEFLARSAHPFEGRDRCPGCDPGGGAGVEDHA